MHFVDGILNLERYRAGLFNLGTLTVGPGSLVV